MKTDILTVFFPAGLLDYFEVESHKSGDDFHEFQLVEKNEPPDGYKKSEITSKGFYEGGQISDLIT